MAKAAGEALALTLAKEAVRNGVRVNIVAPSLTVSDMGERLARAVTGNDDIHHLDAKSPFGRVPKRSDEHTSELQSLMRISYAVFCLKSTNTLQQSGTSHQHPSEKQ